MWGREVGVVGGQRVRFVCNSDFSCSYVVVLTQEK